ncbi:hypothetical protein O181_047977 [Austropuccinia psidii MF-1]|uniref:Uncharacterized protein n=1 Tax=Austropuccinia psidii MF-1 TaxID=1389203 RepID=A0A9Q3DYX6_9BASI|nr:hypothetical protein [Austropuccinia psidii MF-1]
MHLLSPTETNCSTLVWVVATSIGLRVLVQLARVSRILSYKVQVHGPAQAHSIDENDIAVTTFKCGFEVEVRLGASAEPLFGVISHVSARALTVLPAEEMNASSGCSSFQLINLKDQTKKPVYHQGTMRPATISHSQNCLQKRTNIFTQVLSLFLFRTWVPQLGFLGCQCKFLTAFANEDSKCFVHGSGWTWITYIQFDI